MTIGPIEGRAASLLAESEPEAQHESTPAPRAEEGSSAFAKVLDGLGREVNQGEAMTRAALHHSRSLAPSELLALQAGIYRYNESIDLASRLVVGAANSLRTVLQGQG